MKQTLKKTKIFLERSTLPICNPNIIWYAKFNNQTKIGLAVAARSLILKFYKILLK